MGGQMQQSNAAALYNHSGSPQSVANSSDAGDAVMARWLQSAGLQHLASPVGSSGIDHRLLPNLLMQGYGAQSLDEKQRLFKILKSMNLGGEPGHEPFTPPAQSSSRPAAMDGFLSPELRGEFGAGLLDLHAMDDTELLSEHAISEPFEASPFVSGVERGFENGFDTAIGAGKQHEAQMEVALKSSMVEKETSGKEGNLAKIKVVVRKRPLNKKELARKEEDIVTVHDQACLTVHEPKLKVDLTAYVEKHEFVFDSILDERVTNDEVYRVTVEPIVPTIFQRTKATCFAYGQTGSGKTFTMQPLPLKASADILKLMRQPFYQNQGFRLWLSFFEIYGGKLYDLLSDRRKLCMREDGRQQVCIVGLREFEVSDVQVVKDYIEKGNGARSTGSTGANEESSRSHAILQLAIKKHGDGKESKGIKTVGKLSFIDLAGSERGADTTDNDRQTRMEGAEINKSLLALKECIRALDNDQIHIPFRGSKLTEVLRDSFVGNSRTVMISCISPNAGSCEHTLNTLRYADRVKGLSKSSSYKKDLNASIATTSLKDSTSLSQTLVSMDSEEVSDYNQEVASADNGRRPIEGLPNYNPNEDFDWNSSSFASNYASNKEESGLASSYTEKNRANVKENIGSSTTSQKVSFASVNSFDMQEEDKVQKASPTRRKVAREERTAKQVNLAPKEDAKPDMVGAEYRQQQQYKEDSASNSAGLRFNDGGPDGYDGHILAILEEEDALIAAHRKEIDDTMEILDEEMNLLTEVDRPGSRIDNYVSQLSFVLSRKAAGLVNLQARLARFQRHLKEQESLSWRKGTRQG